MLPPFHSISSMAWLTGSPSTITGVAMAMRLTVNVQPGLARTDADTSGWSRGNCTRRPTVAASARSLGTRNVITVDWAPAGADAGFALTCADAGDVTASAMATATTAPASAGRLAGARPR